MQYDHVLKKLIFDLLTTPPKSTQGRTQAFDQNSRLIRFIFIVPLSAREIPVKIIDIWVNAKFKYFTFDPT